MVHKYTDAPKSIRQSMQEGRRLSKQEEQDLGIPSPSELAKSLRTKRTTIILSETTIETFKEAAKKEGIAYQQLIRSVLDHYAHNQG